MKDQQPPPASVILLEEVGVGPVRDVLSLATGILVGGPEVDAFVGWDATIVVDAPQQEIRRLLPDRPPGIAGQRWR